MALPIHTSPGLTGESAELFVKEAECRPVTLGKLTKREEELLERVKRSSIEFKEKIFRERGIRL